MNKQDYKNLMDSKVSQSAYSNGSASFHSCITGFDLYTSRPTCTSGLCCIKAVPAGINYSLEEQEIGTWIDGKPLYQKTIDISSITVTAAQNVNALQNIAHNIANIDKVIRSYGVKIHAAGTYQSGPYDSGAMLLINKTYVRYGTSDADTNYTQGYVTLQYTKATD